MTEREEGGWEVVVVEEGGLGEGWAEADKEVGKVVGAEEARVMGAGRERVVEVVGEETDL